MSKCEICGKDGFRFLGRHLSNQHSEVSHMEYYHTYVAKSAVIPKCVECGVDLEFIALWKPYGQVCSKECKSTQQSKLLKSLNQQSDFSAIALQNLLDYNMSDGHRTKVSEGAKLRRLRKGARGFNSEHSDRVRNCENIISRHEADSVRYLYVVEYYDRIKVGSTSALFRRLNELKADNVFLLYKGNVKVIAELERDLLVEFEHSTLLDESGKYYTEALELRAKDNLITWLSAIESSTTIEKLQISEELSRVESKPMTLEVGGA